MSLFDSGRIILVKHPEGSFPDGSPRYRMGNFSHLIWASTLTGNQEAYVVTEGDRVSGTDYNLHTAPQHGQEFGYAQGDELVIEPHLADGSDSIVGLHFFGDI